MFFFFKPKAAYEVDVWDWGSNVCSSDLALQTTSCHSGPVAMVSWRSAVKCCRQRGRHGCDCGAYIYIPASPSRLSLSV